MKEMIFFGENGLTSTSANHIANMAKECYQTLDKELSNFVLYDTTLSSIVVTNSKWTISKGATNSDIEAIPEKLKTIAKIKALIAWLREAIKARKVLNDNLYSFSIHDYCRMKNIEMPESVQTLERMTEDDYISTLSVKDRNRYYTLEAFCATIGKCIHSNGSLSHARQRFKEAMLEPISVSEAGRDTLVKERIPSVSPDLVEDTFFKLQAQHRKAQAELNSMKHAMEMALQKDKFEKFEAEVKAQAEYNEKMEMIRKEYNLYINNEQQKIAQLKIIIPNDLKDIYNTISKLGK